MNNNLTSEADVTSIEQGTLNFHKLLPELKTVLHQAIFPAIYNAIPLRSKLLTKIARVTSLCATGYATKIARQVAEKVEQSSTFRNVAIKREASCSV